MKKRVAVLAVNPVNGSGLFQYLEAFYENGISTKYMPYLPPKTFGPTRALPCKQTML